MKSWMIMLWGLVSATAAPLLTPEAARAKMEVPRGFSVDLIAAEPDIAQPIAFAWDAAGRLWVVEGHTYPTRAGTPPKGSSTRPNAEQLADLFAGRDRVVIFADRDRNGSFETRTVFLEKLNLVSGIEIGPEGVFLGAAPYLLHVPDQNHDDVPDGAPEILLDGWGYQDTHETLNSFVWGPDGWLYGCHGVFTHSRVGTPGTPDRERVPLNCAYWRFHPARKEFSIFAHGTSNSWGFDFNEHGDWFSEACVIEHFWHIIPGAYYLRQSNPLGHFNPYVYQNIETIADHLHYVGKTPHGGNGVSDAAGGGHAHCGLCIYDGDNFPPEYRGRPLFFNIHGQRINQERLVPKGSGYVAQHLPDFLKTNDPNFTGVALKVGPDGAVYFIDWYDQQKCHRPEPEIWDRTNGRLYRVKFDATWRPWDGKKPWAPRPAVVEWKAEDLKSTDPERRKQTVYALAEKPNAETARLLSEIARGEASPRVRLALASAAQRVTGEARWMIVEALALVASDATDHNLPPMIWYALEPLVNQDITRALRLAATTKIPILAAHVARRLAEDDRGVARLLESIGPETSPEQALLVLRAVQAGVKGRLGLAMPKAWEAVWQHTERSASPDLRSVRASLATSFGDRRAFPDLRREVMDAKLPAERRELALQILVEGRDPELRRMMIPLLDDPVLRLAALQALPRLE
jgi:putative membrane-bound dehydrogenase-like protein